jgi:hypothetical protein
MLRYALPVYRYHFSPVHTVRLELYCIPYKHFKGPGSSVGIATNYGLDGPGIESRWGEIFPHVQTGPGAHPASCTMGTWSFPGVKRPGRSADHPPPPSTEVMKE